MSRTVRKTKAFKLFEGTLQARGCFAVVRLADNAQTYWDTGTEGHENAKRLRRLNNEAFDKACSNMEFHQ